jgi:hypothetical protein
MLATSFSFMERRDYVSTELCMQLKILDDRSSSYEYLNLAETQVNGTHGIASHDEGVRTGAERPDRGETMVAHTPSKSAGRFPVATPTAENRGASRGHR